MNEKSEPMNKTKESAVPVATSKAAFPFEKTPNDMGTAGPLFYVMP